MQRPPFFRILLMLPVAFAAAASSPAEAEEIPFDDPRWTFDADRAEIVEFHGREALYLDGGRAWLPGVRLTDGVIEFDIAFGPERGFSGAMFRLQERGDFENFYFRPHQGGKPDASQYTPEVQGVSGWQLYHALAFAPPFTYRFDEWMHVEIAFSGERATVSLDGETYLVPRLKRPVAEGAVGLHSGFAPARFANFRYHEGVPESFPDAPAVETEPLEVEGLVRTWRISEAFSPDDRPAVVLEDGSLEDLAWTTREIEPEGFVNLAWAEGGDDENRSVAAEDPGCRGRPPPASLRLQRLRPGLRRTARGLSRGQQLPQSRLPLSRHDRSLRRARRTGRSGRNTHHLRGQRALRRLGRDGRRLGALTAARSPGHSRDFTTLPASTLSTDPAPECGSERGWSDATRAAGRGTAPRRLPSAERTSAPLPRAAPNPRPD